MGLCYNLSYIFNPIMATFLYSVYRFSYFIIPYIIYSVCQLVMVALTHESRFTGE